MKILLVENRHYLAHLYTVILQKAGHDVIHREDGREGITAMEAEKPDLVFLDLKMSGMDGFDVLRERQTRPDLRSIPVVVLSSLEKEGLAEELAALGANGYIHKMHIEKGSALLDKVEELVGV